MTTSPDDDTDLAVDYPDTSATGLPTTWAQALAPEELAWSQDLPIPAPRRRSWLAVTAVAAALLVAPAGAVGWLLTNHHHTGGAPAATSVTSSSVAAPEPAVMKTAAAPLPPRTIAPPPTSTVVVTLPPPPASTVAIPAPNKDAQLLARLRQEQVPVGSDEAITAAALVCARLAAGDAESKVINDAASQADMTRFQVTQFVIAANDIYCPQWWNNR